jgi:peptidoglycan L-alanyl-D-glutamate endopeptidase CwlK
MKDVKTLERIKLLHPNVRAEVDKLYTEISNALTGRSVCRFTHTLRTIAEQDALYAQGRTKAGKIVTHARGGQSFHNYGLAIDICLIIDGKEASWQMDKDWDGDKLADWMEVVKIFQKWGWEWGGSWSGFKDYPHFQKTFGYTTSQLKVRLDNGYPAL